MQLTIEVPDSLAQEVSGLTLSEQTLAKDWLNDEEDEAWAHFQHVK